MEDTFVVPSTVRIPLHLPSQEDAWIDVKRELTTGEAKRIQASALEYVSAGDDQGSEEKIGVSPWKAELTMVDMFIVDWNMRDRDGKVVPKTRQALQSLSVKVFDLISQRIQQHRADVEKEKNAPLPTGPTTMISASES